MATCSSADSVLEASSLVKANSEKLDKFVNGTNTQTVQLGAGDATPVIRNVVRQMFSAAAEIPNADISGKTVLANSTTEYRTLAARFGDVVNVKDFGAVGDGVTDDSAAFAAAWEVATTQLWWQDGFNADTFWAEHGVKSILYIPPGRYIIKSNHFLNTPQPYGETKTSWGCKIQGTGMFASQIVFQPNENGAAMYDQSAQGAIAYWGLEFNNIGLIFDDYYINYSGISEANKVNWFFKSIAVSGEQFQFLNFTNCLLCGTKYTILYQDDGTHNASENKFTNCRLRSFKNVLKLDNYESLNHVFIDTDIESMYGDMFCVKKATEITWVGGSAIFKDTAEGECAIVGFDNNTATLTGGQISIQNVRAEFRSPQSRAIRMLGNGALSVSFSDCKFSVLLSNQNFGKCSIGNLSNISFLNCSLPNKASVSRFEFVENTNEGTSLSGGTDARAKNECISFVVFRDCMSTSGITLDDYDFYCKYPEQTNDIETNMKRIHTVIYDNCQGLPSVVEYSSPYRGGATHVGKVCTVPFCGMLFPYVEDGEEITRERFPKLLLPMNSYVSVVNVHAFGDVRMGASPIVIQLVDEVEFENAGSGTIYGSTVEQAYSSAFNSVIAVNKCFRGSTKERTLRLRVDPSYIQSIGVIAPRRPDEWSVYAVVN